MTNEEASRILHCPSAYLTDEDSEFAHTIPLFSKAYGQAMAVAFEALEQQPCEDCISRQAVLEGLRTCYDTETKEFSDGSEWINYEDAVAEIENLPSVTPQPKIGRWEYVQYDKPSIGNWHCSECGRIVFLLKSQKANESPLYDYCPWCGAKMEESESEGKPSFWWKCERCGKLIPYMADFCHECAYELFGEPPKPFELQGSEVKE